MLLLRGDLLKVDEWHWCYVSLSNITVCLQDPSTTRENSVASSYSGTRLCTCRTQRRMFDKQNPRRARRAYIVSIIVSFFPRWERPKSNLVKMRGNTEPSACASLIRQWGTTTRRNKEWRHAERSLPRTLFKLKKNKDNWFCSDYRILDFSNTVLKNVVDILTVVCLT